MSKTTTSITKGKRDIIFRTFFWFFFFFSILVRDHTKSRQDSNCSLHPIISLEKIAFFEKTSKNTWVDKPQDRESFPKGHKVSHFISDLSCFLLQMLFKPHNKAQWAPDFIPVFATVRAPLSSFPASRWSALKWPGYEYLEYWALCGWAQEVASSQSHVELYMMPRRSLITLAAGALDC